MDRQAAAAAIRAFLQALGQDIEGDLARTPELVAAAWCDELLDGYAQDPRVILDAGAIVIPAPSDDLVILRHLQLTTMCPHHLLPAHGHADVVFLPGERLAGFGAIARALSALAHRLVLQEHLGRTLATLLLERLGARGALCRLRLRHSCLHARGPRQHAAEVETIALVGCFSTSQPDRAMALAALNGGGGGSP